MMISHVKTISGIVCRRSHEIWEFSQGVTIRFVFAFYLRRLCRIIVSLNNVIFLSLSAIFKISSRKYSVTMLSNPLTIWRVHCSNLLWLRFQLRREWKHGLNGRAIVLVAKLRDYMAVFVKKPYWIFPPCIRASSDPWAISANIVGPCGIIWLVIL